MRARRHRRDVDHDVALRLAENCCAAGPPLAAALDGSVRPETLLAAFNGEALNGSWRLNVTDLAPMDTGSLLGWCLRPNSLAPVATRFTCGQGDTERAGGRRAFSLSFSYSDLDGDAESWRHHGAHQRRFGFRRRQRLARLQPGGTLSLDFSPFTCPSMNCPDTDVDYTITIADRLATRACPCACA
ncbi:MAG: proprotein convertase P-domain-containing protein [Candidatus Binatia bacterium]